MRLYILPILIIFSFGCQDKPVQQLNQSIPAPNPKETIEKRFPPPAGYTRVAATKNSYTSYLRSLLLHPKGHPVHYYNGELKYNQDAHVAVLDIDVGDSDLQQCADAIMRLRAEFLYEQNRLDEISFNFTSGFPASYKEWRKGKGIQVDGNKCKWVPDSNNDSSYRSFREYLQLVFMYAGTYSLSKELKSKRLEDIQPGDILIWGGMPGHAVIVVDMTTNAAGEKAILLAQSFMPAQEIHVLKNPSNASSPWYELNKIDHDVPTPEYLFDKNQVMTFEN